MLALFIASFLWGGEFDLTALNATSLTLIYYAPGLLFVGLSRVAAQTFYAMKDTRTPVLISFWTLIVNAGLGYLLMGPLQYLGLALALSLASAFNALLLIVLLRRRVGPFIKQSLLRPLWGVLPATVGMIFVATPIVNLCDWYIPGEILQKSLALFFAVTGGGVVFFVLCLLFKVEEVSRAWQLLRRRRGAASGA